MDNNQDNDSGKKLQPQTATANPIRDFNDGLLKESEEDDWADDSNSSSNSEPPKVTPGTEALKKLIKKIKILQEDYPQHPEEWLYLAMFKLWDYCYRLYTISIMADSQFDKKSLINAFNRVARTYQAAAFFQDEVCQRLIEHLDPIKLEPNLIVDLGAKTGHSTRLLKNRYPQTPVIAVDIAENMLREVKRQTGWFKKQLCLCADPEQLSFASQSVDMVFANLTFPWALDSKKMLREIHRILRPNGLFLFSSLGPDTLHELRQSWAEVDDKIHMHNFIDMHDLGDMLVQTKFSDPVMEMEYLTLTYEDVKVLLRDLKNTAWQNLAINRENSLTGKQKFQQFLQAYENYRREDKQIPATYEIIYGHAWKAETLQIENVNGEVIIPISQIRRLP